MNTFNAIGNIGQDAEVRFTKNGGALTSFSVGVSSGWGDNKTTTWVNCTLWGKKDGTPAPVSPYLVKGQKVGITGEISLREWESNGKSGTSLECRINNVTLCGEKKAPAQQQAPAPAPDGIPDRTGSFDDDIPF